AVSHRGIQVDHLHDGKFPESFNPLREVVELESLALALYQLNDLAAHHVDGRNQHGSLIGMFLDCRIALSSRMSCTAKWKTEAARAASARPVSNTSTKWSLVPAPPDAITGIATAELTAAVSPQSKPVPVPSRSIEVSSISPAPCCSASWAHPMALRPVGVRPPATRTS